MKVLWMLTCDKVKKVCVENYFYDAGSNEDYENLFSKIREKQCSADSAFTLDEVVEIATDISNHTDAMDATVEYVLEDLLNEAYTVVR